MFEELDEKLGGDEEEACAHCGCRRIQLALVEEIAVYKRVYGRAPGESGLAIEHYTRDINHDTFVLRKSCYRCWERGHGAGSLRTIGIRYAEDEPFASMMDMASPWSVTEPSDIAELREEEARRALDRALDHDMFHGL